MGFSTSEQSYLPSSHKHHFVDPDLITLSKTQAIGLLEQIGWRDDDQDPTTPRVAQGIPGVPDGTRLEFTLLTTDDTPHMSIAERVEVDLEGCGIGLKVEYGNPEELFTPWPNGPIFGGRYDMVSWAWPTFVSPPCEMFAGFEIPTVDQVYGINASGFRDPDYDRACRRILFGPASGDDYLEAVQQTQEIVQAQVPMIPLYLRPRAVAFGNEICQMQLDPSSYSALWNLEGIRRGEGCTE
jgi:peptide/nickel transport system substrate-binding protein